MPRPPKRINPQAHNTADHSTDDGRAFTKGRFAATKSTPATSYVPVEDVTVDLTDDDGSASLVVIDLTKLPPVDPESGSDTFYIRHSDGWPTVTD